MRPKVDPSPKLAELAHAQYPRDRLAGSGEEVEPAVGAVSVLAARWSGEEWLPALDGTLLLRVDALGRPLRPVYATAARFDRASVVGWVVAAPPWQLDPAEVVDVISARRRRPRSRVPQPERQRL